VKSRFLRRAGAFALLSLGLIGCVRQIAPPSPPPPPTSRVVASLYNGPGFTDSATAWSLMPRLVIYADGRVIVTSYAYVNAEYTRSVELAQVAPAEVCSLLAQIDGAGFFDYDPADYPDFDASDLGTTEISVDAWRSKQVSAYGLSFFLNPEPEDGIKEFMQTMGITFSDALSSTYSLLSGYRPPNPAPYQPERVVLLIDSSNSSRPASDWPLDSPSLKDLLATVKEDDRHPEVVLEGQQAADVYALFGQLVTQIYADGDTSYEVTLRPLLPQELWEREDGWGRNAQFAAAPDAELACDR
jgi:hypothetical protein